MFCKFCYLIKKIFIKIVQEEKKNGFIEVSNNYGNKYGTNKEVLKEITSKGKICVLEVDVEAGQKIHKILPNSNFIFFNVKDIEMLKERMKKRYFFL